MNTYNIILADDHLVLRRTMRKFIEAPGNLRVIGETGDGYELLNMVKNIIPDMVILSMTIPNIGGMEATRNIKKTHPEIKVLILSMHKSKEYLYHAISAGADGYLLKDDFHAEIFPAVDAIQNEEIYLSFNLSTKLPAHFLEACSKNQRLDLFPKNSCKKIKTCEKTAEKYFNKGRQVRH